MLSASFLILSFTLSISSNFGISSDSLFLDLGLILALEEASFLDS